MDEEREGVKHGEVSNNSVHFFFLCRSLIMEYQSFSLLFFFISSITHQFCVFPQIFSFWIWAFHLSFLGIPTVVQTHLLLPIDLLMI